MTTRSDVRGAQLMFEVGAAYLRNDAEQISELVDSADPESVRLAFVLTLRQMIDSMLTDPADRAAALARFESWAEAARLEADLQESW